MKVVFCDVDGTFHGLHTALPQGNKEAVAAFQQQGDHFVFVTGRGMQRMSEFMTEHGLDCDVIFANGAGVKRRNQEAVIRHPLELADIRGLLTFLEANDVLYFVHTTENIVMPPLENFHRQLRTMEAAFIQASSEGSAIAAYKKHFFETVCVHVEKVETYLANQSQAKIMKIEILEPDPGRLAWLKTACPLNSQTIFQSYYATLEIVDSLSTKGAAIQEYLAGFEQKPEKSYGIGDGENDITMWQAVDVPVAVANTDSILHPYVKQFTLSCQEGGVGHFIREYLLREKGEEPLA